MKHVEQDLTTMRKAIDKARDMRYRAEAKLEELENQRTRLLNELEDLGVSPDSLDDEINRLEREIEQSLNDTWALIPRELINNE
ncbi:MULTISPECIES: hypothetical protein [Alkalihalophilus]|jgi:chromosome segregation ATPase|uniref:Viral A-type inclusion protein n=3 Tax=Alkalihalophilus TaxID=2893060 RepID=D3FTX1_ALKPO|nr:MULTISPECIES: hypothetical protein [Alkalihalophilus]ADC51952.1 hypothetical protein BpOF4_19565 [Alkalihalophilus pseudofirmus OF4]ERN53351.1 viral A-type inclusion protein [Alkalihalophilus marmarensis DSM 21297]MCM3489507.1 hypothetical protein [Alkalihalophilus marmarensis]MDV2885200.1 hypothetical protein [Alkalihalophilus pseudofirmus]MEC2073180.1 hypothetical protein [Alkalihalophilus marmarensis]